MYCFEGVLASVGASVVSLTAEAALFSITEAGPKPLRGDTAVLPVTEAGAAFLVADFGTSTTSSLGTCCVLDFFFADPIVVGDLAGMAGLGGRAGEGRSESSFSFRFFALVAVASVGWTSGVEGIVSVVAVVAFFFEGAGGSAARWCNAISAFSWSAMTRWTGL